MHAYQRGAAAKRIRHDFKGEKGNEKHSRRVSAHRAEIRAVPRATSAPSRPSLPLLLPPVSSALISFLLSHKGVVRGAGAPQATKKHK